MEVDSAGLAVASLAALRWDSAVWYVEELEAETVDAIWNERLRSVRRGFAIVVVIRGALLISMSGSVESRRKGPLPEETAMDLGREVLPIFPTAF